MQLCAGSQNWYQITSLSNRKNYVLKMIAIPHLIVNIKLLSPKTKGGGAIWPFNMHAITIKLISTWRCHVWLHTTLEGLWPHYMNLEVCWDGLWTLWFGLSQFHGHSSWLMCEADFYIGCPYPCPPMPMNFLVGMGAILLVILLVMLQFLNTWTQFE